MNLDKATLWTNAIATVVLGALMTVIGVAGIGLAMLVVAVFNLLLCIIFFAIGKNKVAKTMLLSAAVLLLVGFSVCSMSAINMH